MKCVDHLELTNIFEITHKAGMHARAATLFFDEAAKFKSDVFLARGDQLDYEIDGKSIMQILTLGVEFGMKLQVRVVGDDAEKSMNALEALVKADFNGI